MMDLQSHAFKAERKKLITDNEGSNECRVLFVRLISGSGVSVQTCVYSLWSWSVNVINCRLKN